MSFFNKVAWQSNGDIIICPFGTFKGLYTDNTCYREGITSLLALVYKSGNSYVVTA